MGSGMTVFLTEEVKTMDEWDEVWKCPEQHKYQNTFSFQ